MLIGEGTDGVFLPDEHNAIWKKYVTLSKEQQDILTDAQIPERIKGLQERLMLPDTAIISVTICIRKIFFGELDFPGAEAKLSEMFVASGAGDPNQAKGIVEFIQKEILTIKPVEEVVEDEALPIEPIIRTIRLPLLKAMSEYRHLSEQILTGEKIKLKSSPEPVRPSLGNWLRSYREELGIGFHETAQRGNFLFQSLNCKRLSNDARARLNLILKSVEEDFPLEIDTTHETIIFPRTDDASMELTQVKTQPMNPIIRPRGLPTNPSVTPNTATTPRVAPPVAPNPSSQQPSRQFFGKTIAPEKNVSGETLHFSTGHVLPAEREVELSPAQGVNEALRQMQQPTQGIRRDPKNQSSSSPYSIRPLRSRNGDV